MNNNTKNNNIIPIICYFDPYANRFIIYKQNKNKCGIYRWYNNITRESYIGSSISLTCRFRNYLSLACLEKKVKKGTSLIYNALLKYGFSNFNLEIIEYCKFDIVTSREQYYIDRLKPEYNILNIAGSRLGTKHNEKTKRLIRTALVNRVHSEETKPKTIESTKHRKGK